MDPKYHEDSEGDLSFSPYPRKCPQTMLLSAGDGDSLSEIFSQCIGHPQGSCFLLASGVFMGKVTPSLPVTSVLLWGVGGYPAAATFRGFPHSSQSHSHNGRCTSFCPESSLEKKTPRRYKIYILLIIDGKSHERTIPE